jgi:hypothetical protein
MEEEQERPLGLIARLRQDESGSGSTAKSGGDARKEEAGGNGSSPATLAPRRSWGEDYSGLWYFADDTTHSQIEAIIRAYEAKNSREDAVGELHAAIFGNRKLKPSEGDGRTVLQRLGRHSHLVNVERAPIRHPDLEQGSSPANEGLDELLADLGIQIVPE